MNGQVNNLEKADGSSLFYSDCKTAVCCGILGPVDAKISRQDYSRASVIVQLKPRAAKPTDQDAFVECFLASLLSDMVHLGHYPRSGIDVSVQILQDNGDALSTCVNGLCLAVLDSGLAMRHMVAAVDIIFLTNGGVATALESDKEDDKISENYGTMTYVIENTAAEIVASHGTGNFNDSQFFEGMKLAISASADIFDLYRSIMTMELDKLST